MAAGVAPLEAYHAAIREAWRPPTHLTLSEWADRYFYLSPDSGVADPGQWTTLPYQKGVMDAITDPLVESVSWMKSARVGYTRIILAATGYYIHQDPCPIMLVSPTLDDAEEFSKEEIAPTLRDCKVLAAIVPEATGRDGKNTITLKRFRGGVLDLVGANSGRGFRRKGRRVVFLDEVDAYPVSAGADGDPIKLAIRRTEYFWNRKIVAGSTPLIGGLSRIEKLFLAGDQRRYYVPCTQCGEMAYLVFRREQMEGGEPAGHFMAWPKGKPEAAHFVCRECGGVIEHKDKRAIVEAGAWRAHAPFTGHASFHLWAAYSYSPNASWGQLAQEFVEANAAGREELKTFVNTALGETWVERGDAPEWERLYARRELYKAGTVPEGVLFVTIGVDVQKASLIYEVVGWGRGKESWSIDAGVLEGDTSDTSPAGPWPELAVILDRAYRTPGGIELAAQRMAVDSGAYTQTVYGWCRQFPLSRVAAIKGFDHGAALVGMPQRVDVNMGGKKLKRGYRYWPVVGPIAKAELYGWLRLPTPTDEARAAGVHEAPGYCHFPEYGEEYFKQLTGEQLEKGKWVPVPGRQNHALDCRVYARAAAMMFGLDRFKEADWRRLEVHQGVPAPAPPIVSQATPEDLPTPPVVAVAPPPTPDWAPVRPRHKHWMGPRRSSWLRGRR